MQREQNAQLAEAGLEPDAPKTEREARPRNTGRLAALGGSMGGAIVGSLLAGMAPAMDGMLPVAEAETRRRSARQEQFERNRAAAAAARRDGPNLSHYTAPADIGSAATRRSIQRRQHLQKSPQSGSWPGESKYGHLGRRGGQGTGQRGRGGSRR